MLLGSAVKARDMAAIACEKRNNEMKCVECVKCMESDATSMMDSSSQTIWNSYRVSFSTPHLLTVHTPPHLLVVVVLRVNCSKKSPGLGVGWVSLYLCL